MNENDLIKNLQNKENFGPANIANPKFLDLLVNVEFVSDKEKIFEMKANKENAEEIQKVEDILQIKIDRFKKDQMIETASSYAGILKKFQIGNQTGNFTGGREILGEDGIYRYIVQQNGDIKLRKNAFTENNKIITEKAKELGILIEE